VENRGVKSHYFGEDLDVITTNYIQDLFKCRWLFWYIKNCYNFLLWSFIFL